MQQLERQITITYRWWNDTDKDIKPEHIGYLDECAEERINDQIKIGMSSGELFAEIGEGRSAKTYSGWWERNTKTL